MIALVNSSHLVIKDYPCYEYVDSLYGEAYGMHVLLWYKRNY